MDSPLKGRLQYMATQFGHFLTQIYRIASEHSTQVIFKCALLSFYELDSQNGHTNYLFNVQVWNHTDFKFIACIIRQPATNKNQQKLLFRSSYRKLRMDIFGACWWSEIKFSTTWLDLQHRAVYSTGHGREKTLGQLRTSANNITWTSMNSAVLIHLDYKTKCRKNETAFTTLCPFVMSRWNRTFYEKESRLGLHFIHQEWNAF